MLTINTITCFAKIKNAFYTGLIDVLGSENYVLIFSLLHDYMLKKAKAEAQAKGRKRLKDKVQGSRFKVQG